MKHAGWLFLAVVGAAVCGCATDPTDRIAAHQADFNSWPPDVQAQVRAGRVSVGFTQQEVFLALGAPDAKNQFQASEGGVVTDIWVYRHQAPRLSLGIGAGGFSGNSAVGGGISANGLRLGQDVSGRVIFVNGRVTDVQVVTR